MKKRFLIGLLCMVVVCGVTACGNSKEVVSEEQIETVLEEQTEIKQENQEIEETETTEVEATKSTEAVDTITSEASQEETFESYQMYTNTDCNVRAGASKDTEVVATATVNTEVTVTGINDDWSMVEINGLQAFIKTALLSDTKTEVKQPTSSKNQSNTAQSGLSNDNSQSNTDNEQTNNSQSSESNDYADGPPSIPGREAKAGDIPIVGTTGSDGGGMGGAY